MKLISSLILIVGALFVLGCATGGPNSAPLISDSQTMAEQTFVSGMQYYLEDIYDYDVFFIIQPVIRQALVSGIQQYYLEDIYDYDDAFFVTQPAIKQTAALSIINETPFFITEPVPEQTLVSGIQYYLEDLYDYDEPYFISKTSGEN